MAPAAKLPRDPADAAWLAQPEFVAPLLLQDLVEPRLLSPSAAEVRVRALQDGSEVAFRLEWADSTRDDQPGPARFFDACAVQVPATCEATVPAPQMGEAGRAVEIVYWNAGWQAIVDGRGDTLKDIYPNAQVDHYPFEAASLAKGSDEQKSMAARYSPARALGNNMGGPRTVPVQDLVAEGPGTISPAKSTTSTGQGKRTPAGWAVVLVRRLPTGLGAQAPRSQVAFALWDGAREEVGTRKMRTGWIPLTLRVKP
jgi:DMSO reductase family type II enzyme heme b subunit